MPRKTTPADEWQRVLPQSLAGPVNIFTFDCVTASCKDFMKHPKVEEAQLTKCEVVGLRLYSGVCRPLPIL
eukprot:1412457-Rhodomonas_salina.1